MILSHTIDLNHINVHVFLSYETRLNYASLSRLFIFISLKYWKIYRNETSLCLHTRMVMIVVCIKERRKYKIKKLYNRIECVMACGCYNRIFTVFTRFKCVYTLWKSIRKYHELNCAHWPNNFSDVDNVIIFLSFFSFQHIFRTLFLILFKHTSTKLLYIIFRHNHFVIVFFFFLSLFSSILFLSSWIISVVCVFFSVNILKLSLSNSFSTSVLYQLISFFISSQNEKEKSSKVSFSSSSG